MPSDFSQDVARTFPKDFRLRTASEFKKVYEGGARRASRSFVLFELRNELGYSRFGLTTPRRLGKAHARNKVKRRVREVIRTSRASIPKGFDYVLNPRRSAADRKLDDLRDELIVLLRAQSGVER